MLFISSRYIDYFIQLVLIDIYFYLFLDICLHFGLIFVCIASELAIVYFVCWFSAKRLARIATQDTVALHISTRSNAKVLYIT